MKSDTAQEPQHNFLIRYFKHLYDTVQYIRINGWKEYCLARERYDRHQKALDDRKYKYTRAGEIARNKKRIREIKRAK
jgi:hypothetical protein